MAIAKIKTGTALAAALKPSAGTRVAAALSGGEKARTSLVTYAVNGVQPGTAASKSTTASSSSSSSSGSSKSGGSSGGYSSGGGSSGGGSGGGSGTPSAPVSPGTVGNSEWLQAAGDIFATNPSAMLAARLQDQYGASGGGGLYGMLAPYGDSANALFLAQSGQHADNGTVDSFLNYLNDYWNTLQTPGGRLDTRSALANIFNAPEASPLAAYLTTGTPNDQANRALGLIRGAVQTGYNPLYAQAMMDSLNMEQQRYLGNAARGQATGSFIDYIKQSMPNYDKLFA